MFSEEELLAGLIKSIAECRTSHCALIDSLTCSNIEYEKNTEKLMIQVASDKNLAWYEPEDGMYMVNTNFLSHVKKSFTSIPVLLQRLVDCGYSVVTRRFKQPTPTKLFNFKEKTQTSIAIVTMFSDKGYTRYWREFIKNVVIPEGVSTDIILGDNSNDDKIVKLLTATIEDNKDKYREYHITDLGKAYTFKENEHYLDEDKHMHVAELYSILLREPSQHYDYILKIEDDMEPPVDGFVRLYKQIKQLEKQRKKVACVAGYYKQKGNPEFTCLSMQPEVWGKTPRVADVQPRLIRVEMQGGGFALYRAQALNEVLPYKLTEKNINNNYYMTGWDGTIGEDWYNSGWEQYMDGSIYCEHHF